MSREPNQTDQLLELLIAQAAQDAAEVRRASVAFDVDAYRTASKQFGQSMSDAQEVVGMAIIARRVELEHPGNSHDWFAKATEHEEELGRAVRLIERLLNVDNPDEYPRVQSKARAFIDDRPTMKKHRDA